MCIGCWEEFGSPAADTPEVRAAARAIAAVYGCSCVGGNLHIAIDDWNLEDDNLDFCEGAIRENIHGADAEWLAAEARCLALLRALDEGGRASALALHNGFFPVTAPPSG